MNLTVWHAFEKTKGKRNSDQLVQYSGLICSGQWSGQVLKGSWDDSISQEVLTDLKSFVHKILCLETDLNSGWHFLLPGLFEWF